MNLISEQHDNIDGSSWSVHDPGTSSSKLWERRLNPRNGGTGVILLTSSSPVSPCLWDSAMSGDFPTFATKTEEVRGKCLNSFDFLHGQGAVSQKVKVAFYPRLFVGFN